MTRNNSMAQNVHIYNETLMFIVVVKTELGRIMWAVHGRNKDVQIILFNDQF